MRLPPLSSLTAAAVVAFLASASASMPASAQGLSARDEANARFQTGLKYYDARDFESARLAFAQAHAVLQKPGILLNLALSELYGGRPVEAIAHFEQYMRDPSTEPDKRDRAQKHLDEALAKTAHLEVRTAASARTVIDGIAVEPLPPVFHVMPGRHVVEARHGAKTKRVEVDLRAGEKAPIDLAFEVDEKALSEPAPEGKAPPATTSKQTAPDVDGASSFWGWRSIGGLALVGASAALVGVGIAFRADAAEERGRADDLGRGLPPDACSGVTTSSCVELARAREDEAAAAARSDAALWAGGGALVVGALGVVSALVWPHRSGRTFGALPKPGVLGWGATLSTSFE
jgi:tetratricopeptide (TPR) repeat protein